jgi:hypothetical protein
VAPGDWVIVHNELERIWKEIVHNELERIWKEAIMA